ncbi:predicted protein [Phaeodactylum tricornutum CCAP 1055/1]|uniref:SET domain-containing protein n=1 Tax=Phaeodactylum tricornutum (strain CCAP 1055/1) TaxID=556484 RepID=B7GEF4_PHATC|nr:predicted protein [Phaeodactylum tricornutum CCAP 1055/1]EEC42999.1 predicted protein [Phaeodactylum tricornutum CCAP 1055/1]|eukprot:XP_002185512.1 predicted protein [Phaeodactylum tricornutum CCAP 1055/1]
MGDRTPEPSLLTIPDPSDLSRVFFPNLDAPLTIQPWVGPVEVQEATDGTRGRCLVVVQPVRAGDCLFVTPPTLSVDVGDVAAAWVEQYQQSVVENTLDCLTEQALVNAMRVCLDDVQSATARSFLSLRGGPATSFAQSSASLQTLIQSTSVSLLLGNDTQPLLDDVIVSDEYLLAIVRKNAFGPDALLSYTNIEQSWRTTALNAPTPLDLSRLSLPPRLLGLFPLAAMINHSCVGNAVRVLVDDVMVVHATTDLPAGTELVWSYGPPTTPFAQRNTRLRAHYGFVCDCPRCQRERAAYRTDGLGALLRAAERATVARIDSRGDDDDDKSSSLSSLLQQWETQIWAHPALSNQNQRYLRVGAAQVYIQYLNQALRGLPTSNSDKTQLVLRQTELLHTCMQLHLAFCACHYASTEHLSILHLCYQLASALHVANSDHTSPTLSKVRFWTEQLKKTHMVRYGSLGENVDYVRKMMQHTRTVLRNRNGINLVAHKFV